MGRIGTPDPTGLKRPAYGRNRTGVWLYRMVTGILTRMCQASSVTVLKNHGLSK